MILLSRSYQGPLPTRSMALTVEVLRNAFQFLPLPGKDCSAIFIQILSAPVRPSPAP